MEKVTGIGGVFFRAGDPAALQKWTNSTWRHPDGDRLRPAPLVAGRRTDDLSALSDQYAVLRPPDSGMDDQFPRRRSRRHGGAAARRRDRSDRDLQSYPNGRFARVHDPEGNPVELWEPKGSDKAGAVGPVDHVELFVPDRHEAASWYKRALGLEVVEECRHWSRIRAVR